MSPNSPTSSHRSPSPKAASAHESLDGIRKRVRKACDRCRMKKTKCDGSSPCLRCRTDNFICCSKGGQKMRRRNLPKGYAEMLEKQHNQLVCGLQEMYERLRKASLWEGEPLDESSGRPLTHDILAALNFLEPKEDGTDEDFIEQPRSRPMLEEADDGFEKTPADSSQEFLQLPPHDVANFVNPDLPVHTTASRSSSMALSPTTPGPPQIPGQSHLQSHDLQKPPNHLLPAVLDVSPPIQLDAFRDDSLYCFGASQVSSSGSSLDNTSWCFQSPAMLPPLKTQLPEERHDDMSSHKRIPSAPRPSLCSNWLGNGVRFDSSDFMSDFHQLSPQNTTDIGLRRP